MCDSTCHKSSGVGLFAEGHHLTATSHVTLPLMRDRANAGNTLHKHLHV